MTEEINALIHKAAEILKSFGATEVYLFGSVAKGTENQYSDKSVRMSASESNVFFLTNQ